MARNEINKAAKSVRTKVCKNDGYRPWEHILTDPLPEEFKFLFLIGKKNIFSGSSAKRTSHATLRNSFPHRLKELLDPCRGKISYQKFKKKYSVRSRKSQTEKWAQ